MHIYDLTWSSPAASCCSILPAGATTLFSLVRKLLFCSPLVWSTGATLMSSLPMNSNRTGTRAMNSHCWIQDGDTAETVFPSFESLSKAWCACRLRAKDVVIHDMYYFSVVWTWQYLNAAVDFTNFRLLDTTSVYLASVSSESPCCRRRFTCIYGTEYCFGILKKRACLETYFSVLL